MPKVLNALLGTKFKIVSGYDPGSGMTLALESGETEGVCGLSWSTIKAARPHWITDHKLNVLVQMGSAKLPEPPARRVRSIWSSGPENKQVIELFLIRQETGRPLAAPPGLPADRLALLRRAFDETLADPDSSPRRTRSSLEIEPMTWCGRFRKCWQRLTPRRKTSSKRAAALVYPAEAIDATTDDPSQKRWNGTATLISNTDAPPCGHDDRVTRRL